MSLRTFIAFKINTTDDLIFHFKKIQRELFNEKINWAPLNQLHVTLKFIGDTDLDKVDNIKKAMIEAFSEEKSSEFSLNSIGVFGSHYSPKVIWTGIKPEEKMLAWFNNLKKSLIKEGFEYDRQNFVPHLTLARIKNIDDKKILSKIVSEYKDFQFSNFIVNEIILFKSILKTTGAEHTKLFSVKLN